MTADEIHVRADGGEMALAWDEVADISRTEERLFVFGTAEQALVVPQRAFADPAAYDAFYDQLQSYRDLSSS